MSFGLGAMIHALGGGSEHSPDEYKGRKIVYIDLFNNRLQIKFEDGKTIAVWDNGQSCCENRYMSTDDNLADLIGHNLVNIEVKKFEEITEEYGDHEICFVEVSTTGGFITLANHNEHNGYYGGFGMTITEEVF